jgi:cytochrome c oxidase assembly factor CtaG
VRPTLESLLAGHWQPAWPLDATVLACLALYARAALALRGRWPLHRAACFAAGLAVVVVALQSGLDVYAERLLSVHMAQHMLLMLPAPLLLLAGRPLLLALRTAPRRLRKPLVRLLARSRRLGGAAGGLLAANAVLVLVHVPPVYESALAHPALHVLEHVALLGAGIALWWPLLDADPARRLGALSRIGYLLATLPAMALVGGWLNRTPALAYPNYAAPARALGVSALADQQHAGAIMWVLGSTFVVAAGLWLVMAALVAEERRLQARERRALARGGGGG